VLLVHITALTENLSAKQIRGLKITVVWSAA